jgi:hypothetical protein
MEKKEALEGKAKEKFGDLPNDKKKDVVKQQEELTEVARKQEQEKKAKKIKTADLKDLSVEDVYVEMGDGKPATIGHLNVLARRLAILEGVDEDTELKRFDEASAADAVKLSKSAVLSPASPAAK